MAIATLIIATIALKATGVTGVTGMTGAIAIGAIICVIAAIAGDCSQDLKTGFILGATPKKQQIGEMIGVVASAAAIGFVLYLLDAAWGYGSSQIPAPQATMMKMLVEGIMNAELPWALIFTGVGVALRGRHVSALQPVRRHHGGRRGPLHHGSPEGFRRGEAQFG